ncbi:hypothetical protein XarjCFBP8253_14265 [Xanthomonas arboricola pv. juglandis]|uniref:Uncharacterized protein n=1 Tax=Xanthomonas arboricola TaxID=56448 RepID=A0A2S7A8D6_9XANT|nr:hypothetical protein XarjCFBP8253_14265 [Xanthomonas arboricola pv. juglandis]PPU04989.1 hypothetical protein XarjCFBP7645_19920 [Xanthomonas arboricola]PPU13403.1 hypothetical protein XacyCFBP2565_13785 [Xanthomonas arboricola pv. corylina]PPU60656.1 hypothetical protein XacyCFBP1159_10705 [Xanthomonas arboricola pv. corylina]
MRVTGARASECPRGWRGPGRGAGVGVRGRGDATCSRFRTPSAPSAPHSQAASLHSNTVHLLLTSTCSRPSKMPARDSRRSREDAMRHLHITLGSIERTPRALTCAGGTR